MYLGLNWELFEISISKITGIPLPLAKHWATDLFEDEEEKHGKTISEFNLNFFKMSSFVVFLKLIPLKLFKYLS